MRSKAAVSGGKINDFVKYLKLELRSRESFGDIKIDKNE
jgi:hypothetical protein